MRRKVVLASMRASLRFRIILVVCAFLCAYCGDDPEPVDCELAGPIISLGTVEAAASCSNANGSISVSASRGKEPFIFTINGQSAQGEGKFTNLAAGLYTLTVTDANSCSAVVENVMVKASDFSFATVLVSDTDCTGGNGGVTIDVEQLNPPYTYRMGTGSFGDTNSFSGLVAGTYGFAVKDNNGCSVNLSVTVPRGFSGTSWTNTIQPIIAKSCALSGCHNGESRPDLRVFDNAKLHARAIKSKTQDRSMPREGTLTQREIDLIACWVDDGALSD